VETLAALRADKKFEWQLWTDGSCTQQNTKPGFNPLRQRSGGAAILYCKRSTQPVDCATVACGRFACPYTCEAHAMRSGLQATLQHLRRLRRHTRRRKRLLICTDSQSLIQALNAGQIRQQNAVVAEITQMFIEIARLGVSVTVQHVYSHCGLPRNDAVDALAKRAARIPDQMSPAVWHSDFVAATARLVDKQRHDKYVAAASDRAQVLGTATASRFSGSDTLSRAESTLLAQLRTNECPRLGRLAHRLGISMVTSCRWCCDAEHAAAPAPIAKCITGDSSSGRVKCLVCSNDYASKRNACLHMMAQHSDLPDFSSDEKIRRAYGIKSKKSSMAGTQTKAAAKQQQQQQQFEKRAREKEENPRKWKREVTAIMKKCELCDRHFSRKPCHYKTHLRSCHPDRVDDEELIQRHAAVEPAAAAPPPITLLGKVQCPYCAKVLSTKGGALKRHINAMHPLQRLQQQSPQLQLRSNNNDAASVQQHVAAAGCLT
jgi:ribonuclease HI